MKTSKLFSRHNISRFGPAVLTALIAAEALIMTALMLQTPSEAAAGAVFGYSVPRILLVGILLALAVPAAGASIALFRSEKRAALVQNWISLPAHRSRAVWAALLTGVLAWIGVFTPAYRLGALAGYMERLLPLFVLILLIALEIVVFFHLQNLLLSDPAVDRASSEKTSGWVRWGIIMAIIVSAWILIASTGLGIESNGEDFWYEAGVPILAGQALLAVSIGLMVALLDRDGSPFRNRKTDLLIFLAIWIIAALVWMRTPAPHGYFNPGPYAPTNETYPFSDAAKFDLESQFALIGQGLNNGGGIARPVYPVLLVLIHVLTGQNYDQNMNLQAALFAVFPAIIFLIGTTLCNRSAGVAAAAAILMRGSNAIAATAALNLANAKLMLADFPAGIGIALSLFLCILWFRSPEKLKLPLLAGGAIAFSIYLRQTTFGILPALLLLAYVVYRRSAKAWLFASLFLLLAGFVIATGPWEIRGQVLTRSGSYPSSLRKIFFVLENRYPVERFPAATPGEQNATPSSDDLNDPDPSSEDTVDPVPAPGEENDIDPAPDGNNNPEAEPEPGQSGEQAQNRDPVEAQDPLSVKGRRESYLDPRLIMNHFFRNIVTSTLILPDSFVFHDMRTSIRRENSQWRADWNGGFTAPQFFLVSLNLGLLGLGLVTAMRRNKAAGLLPAGMFLGYHLANAFGRTSGGRYIVPVDWIIGLYFMIGLMQVVSWIFQGLQLLKPAGVAPEIPSSGPGIFTVRALSPVIKPALSLLIIGALLILPDFVFPTHFPDESREQIIERISYYRSTEQLSRSRRTFIMRLLENRGALYVGKIIYPRYSAHNAAGEVFHLSSVESVEYPLMSFSLIGPAGLEDVRFPKPVPADIPEYADVIVIGCKHGRIMDAAIVIMTAPEVKVYARDPLPRPRCPLPEPVCDGNGNCE
jgi:hypothetical protein